MKVRAAAILLLVCLLAGAFWVRHRRRDAGVLHCIPGVLPQIPILAGLGKIGPLDIVRSYNPVQGRGPLRVSSINPRYFTDNSGNAVYLAGAHTWANLIDQGCSDPPPAFDYHRYLDFLQANNLNFFRLWSWEQSKWGTYTPIDYWLSPNPFARTGPGLALDGKPKFNLALFDQSYFDRMRDRIIEAGKRGIYASVMLFDGWSVETKNDVGNPWRGHPMNRRNNVNGIDGDLNGDGIGPEVDTLENGQVTAVQEAYVRKVIDTVNDLDNVLYEICNECGPSSVQWQYHFIDYIKSYEAKKPKQHPIGMTVIYPQGKNVDVFASHADWVSPNKAGGYASEPPDTQGEKVVVADTDHLWGIGGDRAWAWKSFTRGLNLLFMDGYDGTAIGVGAPRGWRPDDPQWVSVRMNLGYIRAYANKMKLISMVPRSDLFSTGYGLARPHGKGAEYISYLPDGGSVSIDLTGTNSRFAVEWLNPADGSVQRAPAPVHGGSKQVLQSPFRGDAVVYLRGL